MVAVVTTARKTATPIKSHKVAMALGPQIVAVDAGEQDRGRGGDHIEKNNDSYQIAQAGSNGPRNRQQRKPTPGNGSGSTDGRQ
eukprot:scaffold55487_cov119-Cyclotella_meneghiniana.AAC.1